MTPKNQRVKSTWGAIKGYIVNRIKSCLEKDKMLFWNGEQKGTQKGNKQVAWWMAVKMLNECVIIVIYKMHGSQK